MFLPDDAYAMLMRYERYGFLVLLALSYFGVMSGMMSDAIIGVFSLLYNLFIEVRGWKIPYLSSSVWCAPNPKRCRTLRGLWT